MRKVFCEKEAIAFYEVGLLLVCPWSFCVKILILINLWFTVSAITAKCSLKLFDLTGVLRVKLISSSSFPFYPTSPHNFPFSSQTRLFCRWKSITGVLHYPEWRHSHVLESLRAWGERTRIFARSHMDFPQVTLWEWPLFKLYHNARLMSILVLIW